eukprot:TRINITY_DN2453_c0_g1_i3.p1 TRINITY_DN2453_c0_g1~~TRINITY_DN2453_c0_g1_i3.p1  ORF type:complete len:340 (-),score=47.12 TRINITY_DN2453_c0_g1_i3:118-1137(-)
MSSDSSISYSISESSDDGDTIAQYNAEHYRSTRKKHRDIEISSSEYPPIIDARRKERYVMRRLGNETDRLPERRSRKQEVSSYHSRQRVGPRPYKVGSVIKIDSDRRKDTVTENKKSYSATHKRRDRTVVNTDTVHGSEERRNERKGTLSSSSTPRSYRPIINPSRHEPDKVTGFRIDSITHVSEHSKRKSSSFPVIHRPGDVTPHTSRSRAKTPSDNEDSNERQLDVNPPETYHFDSKTKRDKYRNTRNKSDTSLSSPPGSVKRKFSFSSEGSSDEKVYSIGRNRTVPQTRLRSSSVNETFAPTFSMEQYASKDTPLGRIKDKFKVNTLLNCIINNIL